MLVLVTKKGRYRAWMTYKEVMESTLNLVVDQTTYHDHGDVACFLNRACKDKYWGIQSIS